MEVILTAIKNHEMESVLAAIACFAAVVACIAWRPPRTRRVVSRSVSTSSQEPDVQDLERTTVRPNPLQKRSSRSLCRVAGPAVAAFNAQIDAEEAGVSFTPNQWSFPSPRPSPCLIPEAAKSALPSPPTPATQPIPLDVLESNIKQCKVDEVRPLAHTQKRR